MVQFNPEVRRIALDYDEEQMVEFGLRNAPADLISPECRKLFDEAKTEWFFLVGHKGAYQRQRDGDRIGMNIPHMAILTDVFQAFKVYGKDLQDRFLHTEPPFNPDALAYRQAEVASQKVAKALTDLAIAGTYYEGVTISAEDLTI